VPVAYLIPAETYEWLMEKIEDQELGQLVIDRQNELNDAIEINMDDL